MRSTRHCTSRASRCRSSTSSTGQTSVAIHAVSCSSSASVDGRNPNASRISLRCRFAPARSYFASSTAGTFTGPVAHPPLAVGPMGVHPMSPTRRPEPGNGSSQALGSLPMGYLLPGVRAGTTGPSRPAGETAGGPTVPREPVEPPRRAQRYGDGSSSYRAGLISGRSPPVPGRGPGSAGPSSSGSRRSRETPRQRVPTRSPSRPRSPPGRSCPGGPARPAVRRAGGR